MDRACGPWRPTGLAMTSVGLKFILSKAKDLELQALNPRGRSLTLRTTPLSGVGARLLVRAQPHQRA